MSLLLEEMKGENRLRRVLGPVRLTSLGVGAIIGTGIFVLTGQAAHDKAGPALILSFVVSGIACVFAALCYAEFASMVPIAGSAYTYAYATMGELFAWIIRTAAVGGPDHVPAADHSGPQADHPGTNLRLADSQVRDSGPETRHGQNASRMLEGGGGPLPVARMAAAESP